MKILLAISLVFTLFVPQGFSSNFYVSANASGSGDGSLGNPWQLQQALNSPAAITNPTDTVWIWLRAGVYKNTFNATVSFNCFTNGKINAPIIFRNYNNEEVTIDGNLSNTLFLGLGNCSFTWFWGIEVMNSDTADRDHSNKSRMGNVYCTAENIKFINMIIHDMGSGIDSWKTAKNCETYGCIIYNIGNNQLNGGNWEGHGHGMYLQNDTIGTKYIHNNIIFSTFGYGLKVWQTTNTDAIGNFDFRKNIIFNGGAASENLGGVGNNYRTHNFFVVSNSINNPIRNTVIKHNYTYAGSNTPRPPVNAFGLNYGVDNLTLDSNYITCQTRLGYSNTPIFNANVRGNKIISGIPAVYGYYLWGFVESNYPQNTYIATEPSTGLEYFVMPNKYEQGRAHLAIYNWEGLANVQINLSGSGLQLGDNYELINVMDYFNDKKYGTINATGFISVPMTGHTYAPVIGSSKNPVSQFPKFGAFIIRKVGSSLFSNYESQIKNTLSVHPNPLSSLCNLSLNLEQTGQYNLSVTDMQGKEVIPQSSLHLNQGNQELQLDLKNLQNGVYIVHLTNDGLSLTSKLILNK